MRAPLPGLPPLPLPNRSPNLGPALPPNSAPAGFGAVPNTAIANPQPSMPNAFPNAYPSAPAGPYPQAAPPIPPMNQPPEIAEGS